MNQEVTAIFFSCRRLGLLYKSVEAFKQANTYPIKEIIIVNDSGDPDIHQILMEQYAHHTLVLHPENVGLIKSIDLGYEYIKTEYFFHCEDDWMCLDKGGFIEHSLAIMEHDKMVEEVWLADYNKHPLRREIHSIGDIKYKIASNWSLGGLVWHGFTTAMGLKRMSDYRKIAPYADISWIGTIWHREHAIGEEYYKLGYYTAVLMEDYAINIGRKQSEYKTGYEK